MDRPILEKPTRRRFFGSVTRSADGSCFLPIFAKGVRVLGAGNERDRREKSSVQTWGN